jgi:hypothetical protein
MATKAVRNPSSSRAASEEGGGLLQVPSGGGGSEASRKRCECCGRPIYLMCQVNFCGGLCEEGECGHGPY